MKTGQPLVIAISRQLGSGGSYIGRLVAQRLGYRYTRPRNGSWITFAGSCGCGAANACSTSDVDGGNFNAPEE